MNTQFISQLFYSTSTISNSIALSIFVIAVGSCGTTNPRHSHNTNIAVLQDSLLVDSDGNRYPVKELLDNSLWMTTNLKLNIPDSYCYDNAEDNCDRYGRLYTWETAQKGCALLGKGWRLPTNAEWRQLATLYGGVPKDSVENRKKAYQALIETGKSLFNASLGGGRDLNGQYRRLEAHGFYWTATENDSRTAWFSNFGKNSQSLYHQNEGEKTDAFSVRCVKLKRTKNSTD